MGMKAPTIEDIQKKFEKGYQFKQKIGLYDTVQVNEDFYIGKQWEGVQANGLPTPTFNFIKQVVNFHVANITNENMAVQATPLPSVSRFDKRTTEKITEVLNHQYAAIIERNHLVSQLRKYMRNAAVDGDGCIYAYFDPTVENGQLVKGEIVTEVIENTRVMFGNANSADVQNQPYIILYKREMVEDVKYRAEKYKEAGEFGMESVDVIQADSEKFNSRYDSYTDDKVTVITYLYRNRDTGTIWSCEATEKGILRKAYDTGYRLYPIIWLSWDYIQDSYHGQAMITGLIPNQKFINKLYAMVGVSLMTTAFPKILYNRNMIRSWDGSVGTAVGVNGPVDTVAKAIDGASVSPQIGQFLDMTMGTTKSLLGASDVAMGDSRPDNTSAIIALQRAANTPMEMTRQNMYEQVDDLARIFKDIMSVRYGVRKVEVGLHMDKPGQQPLGMELEPMVFTEDFDFAQLRDFQMNIRHDVGASSYWSEIANMQTLDNLLMNKQITLKQYLERIPNGYIAKRQELVDEIDATAAMAAAAGAPGTGMAKDNINSLPVEGGPGNGALQRALNKQGA
jgi:hypothetical protein